MPGVKWGTVDVQVFHLANFYEYVKYNPEQLQLLLFCRIIHVILLSLVNFVASRTLRSIRSITTFKSFDQVTHDSAQLIPQLSTVV